MCARHTLHAARSRCITHTHRVQPQRRQGVQPGVATRVGSANFSNRHIADAIQRRGKAKKERQWQGKRLLRTSTVQMAAKRILNYAFEWRREWSRCRNPIAVASTAATATATATASASVVVRGRVICRLLTMHLIANEAAASAPTTTPTTNALTH